MKTLVSDDEALAVLGPTFSNSAVEADPVANDAGTPVLAVSNTGPGIVGDCPYPCELVFRDSLGEEAAIPANVETFLSPASPFRSTRDLLEGEALNLGAILWIAREARKRKVRAASQRGDSFGNCSSWVQGETKYPGARVTPNRPPLSCRPTGGHPKLAGLSTQCRPSAFQMAKAEGGQLQRLVRPHARCVDGTRAMWVL